MMTYVAYRRVDDENNPRGMIRNGRLAGNTFRTVSCSFRFTLSLFPSSRFCFSCKGRISANRLCEVRPGLSSQLRGNARAEVSKGGRRQGDSDSLRRAWRRAGGR